MSQPVVKQTKVKITPNKVVKAKKQVKVTTLNTPQKVMEASSKVKAMLQKNHMFKDIDGKRIQEAM